MSSFEPTNPDYASAVRESFSRQGLMRELGIEVSRIGAGLVELRVPFSTKVAQQHGLFHGAVIGAALDSAGGYAALTLAPSECEVLSTEYKLNFIAPAEGDELIASGHVVRAGRTLSVTEAKAYVLKDGMATLCAIMLQSVIRTDQPGLG